jgi:cation diffusion facilitator family transporter
MSAQQHSRLAIYASLGADVLIAAAKIFAATLSGSSSMFAEALHTLADAGNEALLLYGYWRAKLPADAVHPLGYGREVYFWSFMVSVLIFAMGAGVSVYEGVLRVLEPAPIEHIGVNFIVLAFSLVFDFLATVVAYREAAPLKGRKGWLEAAVDSKDPPAFMILFNNFAGVVGVLIAAAGLGAAESLAEPRWDGAASIAIGVLLGAVAWLSARESKGLLIGEGASPELVDAIVADIEPAAGVDRVTSAIVMHLAPDQWVVTLGIEFCDDLRAPQIEEAVAALEQCIRKRHPEVVGLFVKPQTRQTLAVTRGLLYPTQYIDGERLPD